MSRGFQSLRAVALGERWLRPEKPAQALLLAVFITLIPISRQAEAGTDPITSINADYVDVSYTVLSLDHTEMRVERSPVTVVVKRLDGSEDSFADGLVSIRSRRCRLQWSV